ncbi:Tat binding protein 1-interacting protein-domain-containing protein [Pyronema domesticum]|nr:Tat binding protein 1-interacting protein-domain-containing protein [Pyronema domesticum]
MQHPTIIVEKAVQPSTAVALSNHLATWRYGFLCIFYLRTKALRRHVACPARDLDLNTYPTLLHSHFHVPLLSIPNSSTLDPLTMPPKKEKKEQFKGDEATEMIMEYLIKQNRPYSAVDISSNLHNAVTKTTAAKLLKEMHESGQIEGRVSGKAVVYHVIQDPKESATEEDLKAIDEEVEVIKQETLTLKSQLKEVQSSLASLKTTPSVASLNESIYQLEKEVKEMEAQLSVLEAGATKPINPVEKAKADKEYKRIEGQYLKRQKQFKLFWGTLLDAMEGDPRELWVYQAQS